MCVRYWEKALSFGEISRGRFLLSRVIYSLHPSEQRYILKEYRQRIRPAEQPYGCASFEGHHYGGEPRVLTASAPKIGRDPLPLVFREEHGRELRDDELLRCVCGREQCPDSRHHIAAPVIVRSTTWGLLVRWAKTVGADLMDFVKDGTFVLTDYLLKTARRWGRQQAQAQDYQNRKERKKPKGARITWAMMLTRMLGRTLDNLLPPEKKEPTPEPLGPTEAEMQEAVDANPMLWVGCPTCVDEKYLKFSQVLEGAGMTAAPLTEQYRLLQHPPLLECPHCKTQRAWDEHRAKRKVAA